MRKCFLDIHEKLEPGMPESIFQPLTPEQIKVFYREDILPNRDSILVNLDYYDDSCPGQRGYGRNLDRLKNQLHQYYWQEFETNAKETKWRIDRNNAIIAQENLEELKERVRSKQKILFNKGDKMDAGESYEEDTFADLTQNQELKELKSPFTFNTQ